MMITLEIKNTENFGSIDDTKRQRITEIVTALITSGGLTGVKGGQTIIHFDNAGEFRGVQLSYWPFLKK